MCISILRHNIGLAETRSTWVTARFTGEAVAQTIDSCLGYMDCTMCENILNSLWI